ncbi:MAG TPA: GAF domain-containing protein [Alphaproteobacteria bacterium]|nr:hypothetical protein [Rhodospirillaceae bacterium]HRJ12428.1 GAF domain-containing protein [Alphaproteobacteria bacterium]
MGEILPINTAVRKDDVYAVATQQIDKLLRHEPDLTANLANIAAVLHNDFGFLWVGFYLRRDTDLVLGPFQGPQACPRIAIAPNPANLCGQAAALGTVAIIGNMSEFPDYVPCHSHARSVIVYPLAINGRSEMILYIEGIAFSAFDDADRMGLENIMRLIERYYYR